jgi:hypothetical protein
MLTNEIEHSIAPLVSSNYSLNSGIILKLDKPKQKNKMIYVHVL